MDEVLIVDAARIKDTISKLKNPAKLAEARSEVKKMIEIKQTLLWRSDAGTCCGSLANISTSLNRDIASLEKALSAIDQNKVDEATLELEQFKNSLESGPDTCGPGICT